MKKLLKVVLVSFIALMLLSGFGFASDKEAEYQAFIQKEMDAGFQPGQDLYEGWVRGIKNDKNFDVKSIKNKVDVEKAETAPNAAGELETMIAVHVKLHIYCMTPSNTKVTFIIDRKFMVLMKGDKLDDTTPILIFPITEDISQVDGWNGLQDV